MPIDNEPGDNEQLSGLLPVSLDFVFKIIFGDPKNADLTQNLLSSI